MTGFTVNVDLGNPGQLLACCGLLEAADRLWRSEAWVTGWFEADRFCVDAPGDSHDVVDWLSRAKIVSVDVPRAKKASKSTKRSAEHNVQADVDETETVGRASPVCLTWMESDCRIYLDSWSDLDFGRTTIKTFAGQQSSIEIANWLIAALQDILKRSDLENLLNHSVLRSKKKSFNFDQRKGRSGLDVGFSIKETKIPAEEFPATEILAAIGVQFCRPKQVGVYLDFGVWTQPLPVELACAAAGCAFEPPDLRRFRFRLLGRKERSGVAGAPNDQYKAFTRAEEVFELTGDNNE